MRFQELIREVAANPKNRTVENFIKVQSGTSMNFSYYEHHREEDIAVSLTKLAFGLARLRLALLGKAWLAWVDLLQPAAGIVERRVPRVFSSALLWHQIAGKQAGTLGFPVPQLGVRTQTSRTKFTRDGQTRIALMTPMACVRSMHPERIVGSQCS